MIEIKNVSKSFSKRKAVDQVSFTIREGEVFGLIGTNGAGKSTLLRMITGVFDADSGEIIIDGKSIKKDVSAKELFFFIPDEPYFFENATPKDMERYYKSVFTQFNSEQYYDYLEKFELDKKRKISTFSKGMKKQIAILCGICAGTKYLLCDETFDGLDPLMRQVIKTLFAKEMEDRGLTPIIASHNLRELEDICDYVGLLHKGGVLLAKDLEQMKCQIQKVQFVLKDKNKKTSWEGLDVVLEEQRGSLYILTVRGERQDIIQYFDNMDLLFFEVLPLSLEEIFISETEVVGYDIKKLILD